MEVRVSPFRYYFQQRLSVTQTILRLTTIGLLFLSCTPKPPEGMTLILAGPFIMGSDNAALDDLAQDFGIGKPLVLDAMPKRKVHLPSFFMDIHEVTNADYLRFVEAEGYLILPHWVDGRPRPEEEALPVVYVNWHEAQAYCRWIGGRLPTEEEWEKAARGQDERIYPWGDNWGGDNLEVAKSNVGGLYPGLLAVGSFPAGNSPYGVSDMIGNAWEWTSSWYEPYPRSTYSVPEFGQRYRVVRGLSWAGLGHFQSNERKEVIAAQARVTYRWYLTPMGAVEDVGFRCVKSLKEKTA